MRAARAAVLLLAALACVPLAGCGKVPASRYFLIEAAAGPEVPTDAPVVHVPRFTVEPPYDQDRIVYRAGSSAVQVRFYPYDRWAVPLDQMLANLVATAFDGAGGHRFSRDPRTRAADLRLHGHLLWLEEVDTTEGPRVRYRLDLELTRASGEVLHRARLEGDQPAPATEVEDIVRRMQAVLLDEMARQRPAIAAALAAAPSALGVNSEKTPPAP